MKRKRILLAEDDAITRRDIAHTLGEMGFEVMELSDGGRLLVAIAALVKEEPADPIALIITDVRMPVCSGADLVKALRAASCNVPILMITGYSTRPDVLEIANRPDVSLLLKPFETSELKRRVAELTSDSSTQQPQNGNGADDQQQA